MRCATECRVLIATPGRLLDLITQGFVTLKTLEFFVLDEADRMLDMGFIHDIKRILKLIPEKRQTLFVFGYHASRDREIGQLDANQPREGRGNPCFIDSRRDRAIGLFCREAGEERSADSFIERQDRLNRCWSLPEPNMEQTNWPASLPKRVHVPKPFTETNRRMRANVH